MHGIRAIHVAARGVRHCVATLAALALCSAAPAQDAPSESGDPSAADGERLYYEHGCYACHGFNGQTGARDLVGTNSPIVAEEATFITYLRARANEAPVFPSTRMPNYPESALSDAQARDIFAYIRTFELDSPDVEDVPALRTILDSAQHRYTQ